VVEKGILGDISSYRTSNRTSNRNTLQNSPSKPTQIYTSNDPGQKPEANSSKNTRLEEAEGAQGQGKSESHTHSGTNTREGSPPLPSSFLQPHLQTTHQSNTHTQQPTQQPTQQIPRYTHNYTDSSPPKSNFNMFTNHNQFITHSNNTHSKQNPQNQENTHKPQNTENTENTENRDNREKREDLNYGVRFEGDHGGLIESRNQCDIKGDTFGKGAFPLFNNQQNQDSPDDELQFTAKNLLHQKEHDLRLTQGEQPHAHIERNYSSRRKELSGSFEEPREREFVMSEIGNRSFTHCRRPVHKTLPPTNVKDMLYGTSPSIQELKKGIMF
jgi:hypothetical protein